MFLAGSVNYSVSNGNTVTIADTLGGGSDAQITGGFTKSGAGTLVLSGNNSYTGGTTISGGILSIDADNRLGGAGTLTLNGGTLRTTSTMTTSRTTTLTTTINNLDVASGTFTNTGVISGTGRLIKQGPGTLELTGNNSFSGGLVANGGSVSLTGTNAFGTGLFSVNTASVSIPEGSVSNGNGFIGQASGTTGSVTVGGASGTSSWVNNGNLQIGQQGNGTLTVTGGGSLYSIFAFLGGNPSGVGTVNLGGGTGASAWNTGLLSVGDRGRGTLHLTGGGVITSSEGMIGREFTSQGVANVGGGTGAAVWHLSTSLTVGHLGEGVLNITGGGTVSSATATIGGGIDGGTVNVGGGTGASTWNNAGSLIVGTAGRATLNINSGGTVTTGGLGGGNSSSRVRLNGGILRITGTDTASNIINVLSSGGTIELPNSGTNFTHTGSMSGSVSLNKTGPGTLTLAGTGNTRLNVIQGHVNVTGNYSAVTGLTFLNQGASIGGTGTLGGSLAGSGLFSPGVNGTGVLSVNGPINMGNFSSFLVELQGTTPGSGYDQISLTGSYALDNTALLMDRLGDYEAPFLSSFVIIRNSSGGLGAGQFGGLADGDLFSFDGQVFQIRYNVPNNYIVDPTGLQTGYAGITWAGDNGFGINGADNGGNIVIAAVPEPATVTMLSAVTLSVVSYAGYRHRKEKWNKRIGR
jgi:autotransporter-associated beta strand protein/T5SS/PEP-CTERM-associated repeat protein